MLNKKTTAAIDGYYNNGRSWIYSTEMVMNQITRANKVLKSEHGTVSAIAAKLGIKKFEAVVLLAGLEAMNSVKVVIGGGYYTYRVTDTTPIQKY